MLGQTLGSYRITKKLAEGGMGEVYVAYHELMEREAVVKVLHPKLSNDQELVQRFFNEARAAAKIRHPGIAHVYDMGDVDGRAYIVMEYLRGEPLTARIARGPLPVDVAVALTKHLASALGEAHARDIIHRDLKPDNIFLVADPDVPGGQRIKVLDFGIAKLAQGPTSQGSLTAQGAVFGTPAYMAPEQCTNAASVDLRADLYAMGCLLYELLVGEPPFGRGGLELFAAHLRDQPAPPSQRNPQVPPALDAIILALLAKKPDDRPKSCDELIKMLDGLSSEYRNYAAPAPTGAPRRGKTDIAFAATVPPSNPAPPAATRAPAAPASKPASALMAAAVADSMSPAHAQALSAPPASTMAPAHTGAPPAPAELPAHTGAPPPNEATFSPPERPPGQSTLSAASGQLPKQHTLRTSSHRAFRLGLVLVFLAAGAIAAVLWMQTRETETQAPAAQLPPALPPLPSAPMTSADELLQKAREAFAAQNLKEALRYAFLVIEREDASQEAKEEAQRIIERFDTEAASRAKFDLFVSLSETNRLPALARALAMIPEDSTYRMQADAIYREKRDSWLAEKRSEAKAFAERRKCRNIEKLQAEVAVIAPEATAELGALYRACQEERKKRREKDEEDEAPANSGGQAPDGKPAGGSDGQAGQPGKDGQAGGTPTGPGDTTKPAPEGDKPPQGDKEPDKGEGSGKVPEGDKGGTGEGGGSGSEGGGTGSGGSGTGGSGTGDGGGTSKGDGGGDGGGGSGDATSGAQGAASVRKGKLPKNVSGKEVDTALAAWRRSPSARECVVKFLVSVPPGRPTVKLTIEPSGKVSKASIDIGSSEFRACIAKSLASELKFSPAQETTQVTRKPPRLELRNGSERTQRESIRQILRK